jgi:hypothetical protein
MSCAQTPKHHTYAYSLRSQVLFSSLPQGGSRELESKLIFARHNSGSILYQPGEKPKGIFLVIAGRVKMTANAFDEKTALLKIAGPGEVFGLASMVSQTPHLTTAQATEPSFVALLRRDALLDCMQRYPQLSLAVAQCLAAESASKMLAQRSCCVCRALVSKGWRPLSYALRMEMAPCIIHGVDLHACGAGAAHWGFARDRHPTDEN